MNSAASESKAWSILVRSGRWDTALRSNVRRSRAQEEMRLERKRWDMGRVADGEMSDVDADVRVEEEWIAKALSEATKRLT